MTINQVAQHSNVNQLGAYAHKGISAYSHDSSWHT